MSEAATAASGASYPRCVREALEREGVVRVILASSATLNPADPLAIGLLLAALGLSSTAGLRAYLPLLAVGLAGTGDSPLVPLQPSFTDLSSPPVLVILTILVIVEFTIDKVPVIDHLSDLIHTVIRPVSGAVIMAGTQNSLSDVNMWVAAIAGALLALIFHGAKAATRPVVTASTVGHGNPVVSLIEDGLVVLSVLMLTLLPFVGFFLFVVIAFLIWRTIRGIVRWLTGRRKRRGAPARATVVPAPPPVSNGPAGMPGPASTPMLAGSPPHVQSPYPGGQTNNYPTGPDAPTVAATQQPPYPTPAANPIYSPQASPQQPYPTQTQPYPPQWPVHGAASPASPDAPTQPGTFKP
jgi:uncharacterized protein DUF4126